MTNSSPTDEGGTRALKWLVLSLGLILLGGTVFLFVLIAQKMQAGKEPRRCEAAVSYTGTLRVLGYDRGDVVITERAGEVYTIRRIDLCTGEVSGALTLEKQTPKDNSDN